MFDNVSQTATWAVLEYLVEVIILFEVLVDAEDVLVVKVHECSNLILALGGLSMWFANFNTEVAMVLERLDKEDCGVSTFADLLVEHVPMGHTNTRDFCHVERRVRVRHVGLELILRNQIEYGHSNLLKNCDGSDQSGNACFPK